MEIRELREKLAGANARLEAILQRMAHSRVEPAEYDRAAREVHELERSLARVLGEEFATTIDFPVEWDRGAPLPHVIAAEGRTFLIFLVSEPDPNWDGTYVNVKDPADHQIEPYALVEFLQCTSMKLGSPNDEVFAGHPLRDRGMEPYCAQEVLNSRWIAEIEAINRVHAGYNPARWKDLKHYIFWFHDSTFECIAEGFRVETFRESMAEVVARACDRLIDRS